MSVPNEKIKKKAKVRQHFVPRFYLRNFGEKIHCFDKKEERKFTSNPENISVKSDFYGGEYDGLPSLETAFSKIEQTHSLAIKKLLEKRDYYKLSHDEKVSICEFLALQFLRTESARNSMKHVFDEFLNLATKHVVPQHLKVTLTDNAMTGQHLGMIKEYKKYAVLFYNMKFVTCENHTGIPFWTSDNPITKQNEYDKNPLGNLGIVNRGIEIHLPISPNMAIWALDPTIYQVMPNTSTTYNKKHVIRENFLQLKFSSRFVYSSTSRFHLVKSMIKDNPHFKDGTPKNEILIGESEKGTIFMTAERNDRWPIKGGKIMGKMDTWIDVDVVDKIFKDKKLEDDEQDDS